MRRGTPRIFVAAALAAVLGLALVACGGGDDENAGTTVSTSTEPGFEPAPLEVSGDDPELREAAEAVHAFYVARASDEWEATCAQVAEPMLKKLENLALQSERKGCAEFLESFTTRMSDAAWREITVIDADRLRVDGGQASLIYRGAGGEIYSMPLREEDGEWKVEALSATALG